MLFSQGFVPWEEVGAALGVTLTASVRSREPPSLAIALSTSTGLPTALQRRLAALRADLEGARDDLIRLAEFSARAWEELGIASGRRAWSRAGRSLVSLAARYSANASEGVERLAVSVSELRNESFVELDSGDTGAIQLMNFHQTKGREADAVILSYTSSDYYGRGGEPYDEPSRVLYVSMTRARHKIIVLLPPSPHALVRPFALYASLLTQETLP
jgi:DNA helicase II / ATP-dependent DNA helicase PcrA